MNLRDRKNLESAQKRCALAAKEADRAAKVLAGVIKRANAAAERDEKRKAEAARKKTIEWGKSNKKSSGRRLSTGG